MTALPELAGLKKILFTRPLIPFAKKPVNSQNYQAAVTRLGEDNPATGTLWDTP